MIIPFIILIILVGGGVWAIWKGFNTGDIEYGYKYYPPKYISNRKKDPGGFWLAVIIYGFAITVCLILLLVSCAA